MDGRSNAVSGGKSIIIESKPKYNGVESSPWEITTEQPIDQLIFITQLHSPTNASRVFFYPISDNGVLLAGKGCVFITGTATGEPETYEADVSVSGNKITITWGERSIGINNFNVTVGYIPK